MKHADFTEGQPGQKKKSESKGKKPAEEKVRKDDDIDGEQPEPKKKSVSKAKGKGRLEEVVKDDEAAAEEQTEPKKKSVSKGKKPEEVVPASNPTKKKQQ